MLLLKVARFIEASDVQTLNECLKICREQGPGAAMDHLCQAAHLETPKPWYEAMGPIGESGSFRTP